MKAIITAANAILLLLALTLRSPMKAAESAPTVFEAIEAVTDSKKVLNTYKIEIGDPAVLAAADNTAGKAASTISEDANGDDPTIPLPKEILPLLPDELADGDVTTEKIAETTGIDYIFGKLGEMLRDALLPAAGTLSVILGTIMISSAVNVMSRDLSGGKISGAVSMITTLALAVYVVSIEERLADDISTFAGALSTFSGAMVPMMAGLLSASANNAGAAVASSGLLFFSAAVEYVVTYIFIPLFRFTLALAVISSVASPESGVGGICGLIKRAFTWLTAGAATIFSAVLSYQTQLAAAADTAAARGIKYTVGSAIPIVGGALGDAVRTAAAGLSVIKSGAGTVGIVALIFLTCPLLISLFYTSLSLGIASFAASVCGCSRESSLLSELKSATGFGIALVALVSFVFFFALALFMKTAPALYA